MLSKFLFSSFFALFILPLTIYIYFCNNNNNKTSCFKLQFLCIMLLQNPVIRAVKFKWFSNKNLYFMMKLLLIFCEI